MIFNKMIFLHYIPDYLYFTSTNAFSIEMAQHGDPAVPSLEYSKDRQAWAVFVPGETIVSANANEKVYFRGNNSYINSSSSEYWNFYIEGTDVESYGNIMSLLDITCASTIINYSYCFNSIFYGCTSLIAAPSLPATILADYCYGGMFSGCTSLTTAPALPATTLATSCYYRMFYGCTSLIAAPALPATSLADSCYSCMFSNCSSLTTVPKLSGTDLPFSCYYSMFSGCSSLQVYSSSGTSHAYAWSIPTSGTASIGTKASWYMFYGCLGSYSSTKEVALNKTFYTQNEPV